MNKKFTTELMFLPVCELTVDAEYQRLVKKQQVNEIKRARDEDAFGALHVGKRKGGQYRIVDGQHRYEGFKDVYTHLPCTVFRSKGKAHEAAVFRSINSKRRRLSPVEIHVTNVVSGEPESMELDSFCLSKGVQIADSTDWCSIRCVNQLRDAMQTGSLDWVLDVVAGFNDAHTWQKRNVRLGSTIEALSVFWSNYGHMLEHDEHADRMSRIMLKWSKDDWDGNKGRSRDGKRSSEDSCFKFVAAWNRSRIGSKKRIDAMKDMRKAA